MRLEQFNRAQRIKDEEREVIESVELIDSFADENITLYVDTGEEYAPLISNLFSKEEILQKLNEWLVELNKQFKEL